ncbi:MAG: SPFH domain-containing protein, partial [Alphaproteobacteria bacterium]|nr:SPFH domain-containing protein [Alphaproteobacteria bacterium]
LTPTTKDGVTLQVAGSVRFELTSDTEALREFHERVGLRMKASEEEGWNESLKVYLRAPIERAVTDATQGLKWSEIYGDPAVKAAWEKRVGELLPKYVEQTVGGAYFENFSVTLQKPSLPEDLEKALQDAEVAVQQTKAQEQRNSQVQSELEAIRPLVDVLGPDGYNVYQAIKDGRIQIMPIPGGTDVAIPTK